MPGAVMKYTGLLLLLLPIVSFGDWIESPIFTPLVAVAMANLPDGTILMWSSGESPIFYSVRTGRPKQTYTYLWDPTNPLLETTATRSDTSHDMFCPGTSILPDGTLMVTGGSSNAKVSFYTIQRGWTEGSEMIIGRGYHSNTVLSDGSVFVMGGSWYDQKGVAEYQDWFGSFWGKFLFDIRSGFFSWFFDFLFPWDRKDGEVWNAVTRTWRKLRNVQCKGSMVTNDRNGQYRNDNHMWLFQAPNGKVFHAGPSVMTHYISTEENGSIMETGTRGTADAMNGNAILYDIGKLLVIGGAPNYSGGIPASADAFVISLYEDSDQVDIQPVASMNQPRTMLNSVVLPNGSIIVIGGCQEAVIFNDDTAVLAAELWDPHTQVFTELPPMQIPRTYHSTAILLYDGTVLVAGGGLCGADCDVNHLNAEILIPPYLYDPFTVLATRPEIIQADDFATAGNTITATTNVPVASFALVRLSAVTHSVNTDLRRIPLDIVNDDTSIMNNQYTLQIPSNPAVAVPGMYFLFAMDAAGVPSISTTIAIAPPVAR